jgi:hypothetical protein
MKYFLPAITLQFLETGEGFHGFEEIDRPPSNPVEGDHFIELDDDGIYVYKLFMSGQWKEIIKTRIIW